MGSERIRASKYAEFTFLLVEEFKIEGDEKIDAYAYTNTECNCDEQLKKHFLALLDANSPTRTGQKNETLC